ncbi:MAG: YceI family protein [Symploca sp. SIO2G7]|nr:YceI family protein [Symploca sp. SIO2G7]
MRSLITLIMVLALVFAANTAWSNWHVDNEHSRLSFVSIKADTIAEVHYFETLRGVLEDDGQFELTIDLGSVETLIPIRNERMREMLFNTSDYPHATLTAQLNMQPIVDLAVGDQLEMNTEAQLDLVGQTSTLNVQTSVARLGQNRLLVTSIQPLPLSANSLGLSAGVEQLRQVAGLPSISPVVPATFRLTLTR